MTNLGDMIWAEHETSPLIVTLANHGQIKGTLLSDSSTICLLLVLELFLFLFLFFDFLCFFLVFMIFFTLPGFLDLCFLICFFFAKLLLTLFVEDDGSSFGLLFFFKPQTKGQNHTFGYQYLFTLTTTSIM